MTTTSSHHLRRIGSRVLYAAWLLLAVLVPCRVFGQSESASVSGRVTDQQNAVIPNVEVEIRNVDTNSTQVTKTNGDGIYSFPSLQPGNYVMSVRKEQFETVSVTGITLHVQDSLSRNFVLQVGSSAVSVTVTAGGLNMNTTDGSVSTVVDQTYIKNMPLNGRSFQDLILLTPGVVTNNPQSTTLTDQNGQFSVNGQRTESNYYLVDGVSANFGGTIGQPGIAANSGALPASTLLGTTQGLVSVDALEEFRVQSSSYSAEYGRSPGGQFSFVTRSGTNQWHGAAFDYLRNDVFDASDWFNGFFKQPKPPLRQNDFGGTLGGPVKIPGLYNGEDKTFFFFSYEGLRLIQPQEASVSIVPTSALRQSAPSALQPIVNAFPLPNCAPSATNCTNDLGDGLGQFIGSWSNPGSLDSYSVRLDHSFGQKLNLFFRFSDTPSSVTSRAGGAFSDPAVVFFTHTSVRTYTLGATSTISQRMSNEFRVNYSRFDGDDSSRITNFGGSSAVDFAQLLGLSNSISDISASMLFSGFSDNTKVDEFHRRGLQRQWNITDAMSIAFGAHQMKFGLDYRRLTPIQTPSSPVVSYDYFSQASVNANSADLAFVTATAPAYPDFLNFSAFVQDEWRVKPRWSLSLGVRWDVNPAPGARTGNLPYTVQGDIGSPATLALAPQGTPLWRTSWYNFAPRVGTAYVVRNNQGAETVVRGGVGIFFDTGQQLGTLGYAFGPGFSASDLFCPSGCSGPATFPLSPSQLSPPIVNPPVGPGLTVIGFAPHLQLPFTWQWNASVEQAIGKSQALTVSYVGANGRRLLRENLLSLGAVNPTIGTLGFINNGLTSDYDALQVQLQRRMSHGLQVLASYTWSHSIDYGSRTQSLPSVRGNSDFDIRHNFSAAFSYDSPSAFHNGIARAVFGHWGFDDRLSARSGFPVTLNGRSLIDPITRNIFSAGLDVVPNQPLYLYGPQFPGGRSINPGAFALPPAGQIGDAPRNFARGFGAWQMDLAVRREFPIHENLKLQFRAEAFNIFNHPNFGAINASFCPTGPFCTFGQATSTLANSLGGLSPLYQMGGPRSMQFALKLVF